MLDRTLTVQCDACGEDGPALAIHQPQALPSCSPFTSSQWPWPCLWQASLQSMSLMLTGAGSPFQATCKA